MYSSKSGQSSIETHRGSTASASDGAGRKVGTLTDVSIDTQGKIYGVYDNGVNKLLGQIAVANFVNPAGLEAVGNNLYQETMASGEFDGIGQTIADSGETITQGVLEMSNVDLSQEFTDMIVTQRGFQANSRIITVSDTLLEELINLKR
jgi:flagellar hook protein FlgE